jgi:hypothetical protein
VRQACGARFRRSSRSSTTANIARAGLRSPLDSTQSIECGIDIDPFAGTFRLLPAPDAIEQAKQAAVRAIFDVLSRELADLKVPIFLGKP